MLKMDCQGCEWDFFETINQSTLLGFEQIIVEFHDLFKDEAMMEKQIRVLERLNEHFYLFHVHANNEALHLYEMAGFMYAPYLECSFIRKDSKLVGKAQASLEYFPTKEIDEPYMADWRDFTLEFWPFYNAQKKDIRHKFILN